MAFDADGNDLGERCNAIEECYEFMLAYAAQGLAGRSVKAPARRFVTFFNARLKRCRGLPTRTLQRSQDRRESLWTIRSVSHRAGS